MNEGGREREQKGRNGGEEEESYGALHPDAQTLNPQSSYAYLLHPGLLTK